MWFRNISLINGRLALLSVCTCVRQCQNDPDIPEVFNTYSFTDIEDVLESEPGRIIGKDPMPLLSINNGSCSDVIGICEGSSGLTSTQNKTGDMVVTMTYYTCMSLPS